MGQSKADSSPWTTGPVCYNKSNSPQPVQSSLRPLRPNTAASRMERVPSNLFFRFKEAASDRVASGDKGV